MFPRTANSARAQRSAVIAEASSYSFKLQLQLQYVLNRRVSEYPSAQIYFASRASRLKRTVREWPRRNREWRCLVHGARWTDTRYQTDFPFDFVPANSCGLPFFYSEAYRRLLIVCTFPHWPYCPFSAVQRAIFLYASSSTFPIGSVSSVNPHVRIRVFYCLGFSLTAIVAENCTLFSPTRQVWPGPRRIV